APRHERGQVPLAINPTPDTLLLRQAFASRWIYPRTPDGRTDRSRPKKPLSPWADVGDAAAYLCGFLKPGHERDEQRPREQLYATASTADPWGDRRRQQQQR
ncbi:MAG TPA: hypothetical protein VML54_16195, partial [Candidatus Limnocylindrales bacterium]|nr:hypothetical protein [Candidatus Limnocylindrales bacterium]